MKVTINTNEVSNISWGAKGTKRVAQNIVNLLNTFLYEIAYDRTLGLSGKFIDMPIDQAIAIATTEIIELITEREPRATVEEVQFIQIDENGNMVFKVVVDI